MAHYIYIWILLVSLVASPATIRAQVQKDTTIEKPLPRFVKWTDNQHYAIAMPMMNVKTQQGYTVSALDGKKNSCNIDSIFKSSFEDKVMERNGDLYYVHGRNSIRLTETPEQEKVFKLSPDSKKVAFVRNNDLYVLSIDGLKETRLTNDGSDVILNGKASWVYYEEILGRQSHYAAFWWSPDSRHLAFYRFDDSKVPVYLICDEVEPGRPVEYTHYPQAGETNPEVRVGVADVESGNVTWAGFDSLADQYFGSPFWKPDGSGFLVQWMNRDQNNLKLYNVNAKSAKIQEIYNETYPTWIDWIEELAWVDDGFVMVRDIDGWQQIYYHGQDGKLKRKLTTGNNWNTKILNINQKTGEVYYSSSAEISTRTDLYVVGLKGKKQRRLSFGDYSFENFQFSPDYKYVVASFSNFRTPHSLVLIQTSNGHRNIIADGRGPKWDGEKQISHEMIYAMTSDGFKLPGYVFWPSKMEKGKRYPVFMHVYGGPNTPMVRERWVSSSSTENEEIIHVYVDHRGTGHFGKKGMDYMYRHLGKWEMNDYITWVKWLKQQPAVDSTHIIISGGSYGGYISAMAVTYGAGDFNYAICDYPVIDWKLYDSHYTERYMDKPQDNPEGYKEASVLTYVDRYQSKGKSMMLLTHGLRDDNVHVRNTFLLVDALQKANKPFDLMLYPNERHGWFTKLKFTSQSKNNFIDKCLKMDEK